nr:reverse transcriptase domain-containing protein [Tanacetum cinerariifolium]
MEDEFYHLTVKGNDLNTYVRRFQELATLCPTMVSDSEKTIKAFIGRLPRMEVSSDHKRKFDDKELSTATIATATMIIINSRVEGRKPLGAAKSFVSISLASMLNIPPNTLDTTYDIEMANGNL